jgi:polysaccharide biosynthesis protein PslH
MAELSDNSLEARLLSVMVVDEELPYPTNSGKRLRTLNLLRRLTDQFKITYLAYRNQEPVESSAAQAHLKSLGISSIVVPRTLPPKSGAMFYGRLLGNLASSLPYSVSSHTSSAMTRAIAQVEQQQPPDLWHCEWTPYLQSLAPMTKRPIVAVAHNVESQIWQRYMENETQFAKRWYIHHQWQKFRRYETWAFKRANRTVFVSDPDERLARESFGAQRTSVVENGVDTDYFRPTFADRDPRDLHRLLIMGSLDWRPNIDGINQFVEGVFPRLRATDPRFTLTVVGRNPDASWAKQLGQRSGVTVCANVPDVRPYIATAGALVVPLRIGGGSRLKILEAAASGLPVISTMIGAEGLDLLPDQHYVAATDINYLEQAIHSAARDPSRLTRLAHAAHHFVTQQYSWDSLSQKLANVWRDFAVPSPNQISLLAHLGERG